MPRNSGSLSWERGRGRVSERGIVRQIGRVRTREGGGGEGERNRERDSVGQKGRERATEAIDGSHRDQHARTRLAPLPLGLLHIATRRHSGNVRVLES